VTESCSTATTARVEQRADAGGKQPFLCQRCHVTSRHPDRVRGLTLNNSTNANKIYGRSCVVCISRYMVQRPSGKAFLR